MHGDRELPRVVTDADGRAHIEGLTPGDPAFFLLESANGSERLFEPVLVVPEDQVRLTVRLYAPGRALGQVLDDMGQPVAGVTVRLSAWEWLGEPKMGSLAETDEEGGFEFSDLTPGAYYTASGYAGPDDAPTMTWRARPFKAYGADPVRSIQPLFPEGRDLYRARPAGSTVRTIVSGPEDEWFDPNLRRWLPVVETFDPNRAWGDPAGGGSWIWRAGRPDPVTERHGGVVEFRRRFAVDPSHRALVGHLSILADDYALVRLNGEWLGLATEHRQPVSLAVRSGQLREGENELRVTLHNIPGGGRDYYNPTGLAYSLELIGIGH
jgi:hypothetical protein